MARPLEQQARILESIRKSIISGRFVPGDRLPTRLALERKYGASPVTIQRVFHTLAGEGHVLSRGCKGTVVVNTPPHLYKYWLIFPHEPPGVPHTFQEVLTREVRKLTRRSQVSISIHVGHGGHFRHGNYKSLLHDIHTRSTAGLIFTSAGNFWDDTPLRHQPGIPRVALSHGPDFPKDTAIVQFQTTSFIDKALDALKSQERSRTAVIACMLQTPYVKHLLSAAAERGMEIRPYWIQRVHRFATDAARNLTHLMMNDTQHVRPDSLILMDSSLVHAVTRGLQDAGIRIPEEVAIISHANFPYPVRCEVPMQHLGYDLSTLLELCFAALAQQRSGKSARRVTKIEPVFEEELKMNVAK